MSALRLWKALRPSHRAQRACYCRRYRLETEVTRRRRRKGGSGQRGAGLHRRCGSASIRDRGTVSIVGAGNELLESVVTSCWIGWKRVLEYSATRVLVTCGHRRPGCRGEPNLGT